MENNDKNVPKLRFPGFTEAWEQRKFVDLLDKKDGIRRGPFGSSLKKDFFIPESDYVVYEQQNAIYDRFDTRYNITKEKFDELRRFKLVPSDFIMSGAGTIGRISKVPEGIKQGVFNQALIRFRINDEVTDSDFFLQWVRSDNIQRQFTEANPGSAMTNLVPMSEVKEWDIIVPSKAEQYQLGKFFSNLDTTITLHQRKLEKLQNKKKCLLQKMFPKEGEQTPEIRFPEFADNWEQRKLGEVAEICGGGTPSTNNTEYWEGAIDWYSPVEIGEQVYVSESQKKITELGLQKSSARILPIGTVLFTSRAGIGKTAILAKEGATNQGFQSILPHDNKLDTYFIYSRTEELKQYGEINGAGSTFVEVSGKQMARMPIMLPHLSEQKQVGLFFKQIDNLITLQQRKISHLKDRKKVLLRQMFV